jgi:hypothetical protein
LETTLAYTAHCAWEEGNAKVSLGLVRPAGASTAKSPGQMPIASFSKVGAESWISAILIITIHGYIIENGTSSRTIAREVLFKLENG